MSNRFLLALAFVLALGCKDRRSDTAGTESALRLPEDSSVPTSPSRDYRSVAEKVVAQNAGVKDGDLVVLYGTPEDLPLLEDLAIEVRKRGASPLLTVFTHRLARRMYDDIPSQYDTRIPEANMGLARIADVFIGTESDESRTLKGVPPERIAARAKAFAPVGELMRKRGVRSVSLGNGLYPSAERAEQFDISREQLADLMYGGIDVDYQALQATGQQVKKALAGGKELRITSPNGTDLRVGIAGRPVSVNDGIISPEEQRKGGAAVLVWLPAGEVYLTPVAGTAEGTVVSDAYLFQGEPVEGLRLEFRAGKLTSMTAESGLEPLKAVYDAAGQGKDILGVVDIGINPGIKVPEGVPNLAWGQAGTVTVVVGNNVWAGGDNQVNFSAQGYSSKSTVTVDGKPLVQGGKLVVGGEMARR